MMVLKMLLWMALKRVRLERRRPQQAERQHLDHIWSSNCSNPNPSPPHRSWEDSLFGSGSRFAEGLDEDQVLIRCELQGEEEEHP